ncbi:MAG: tRNA 2-thiocytidine(32) synthetase TtcA [Polyangiales bacterium]
MTKDFDQLEQRLARQMSLFIEEYQLIEAGDRVMVCLSGGKDSYTMLHLLMRAQRRAPIDFELMAVHVDQKQPGYDGRPLVQWLDSQSVDYKIIEENTYGIVVERIPEGKTYCSLCSRLRRGILYNAAEDLGCNKIALGHHRDDAIETLLMNTMFNGTLSAMPAKWKTLDGRNTVIRPLLSCAESEISEFAALAEFPILPCNLCGSQENLWRKEVKSLLDDLEMRVPQIRNSMFGALKNVHTTHLLDSRIVERDNAAEREVEQAQLKGVVRLPTLQ